MIINKYIIFVNISIMMCNVKLYYKIGKYEYFKNINDR